MPPKLLSNCHAELLPLQSFCFFRPRLHPKRGHIAPNIYIHLYIYIYIYILKKTPPFLFLQLMKASLISLSHQFPKILLNYKTIDSASLYLVYIKQNSDPPITQQKSMNFD
jgi:hypothetical protein